jgi:hypothetical protein
MVYLILYSIFIFALFIFFFLFYTVEMFDSSNENKIVEEEEEDMFLKINDIELRLKALEKIHENENTDKLDILEKRINKLKYIIQYMHNIDELDIDTDV